MVSGIGAYDPSSRAVSSIRVVSWIVFRAEVFQSKRPHRGHLRDVLAGFRPMEMGRVARENDHGTGRIGFQLTRVEFITQSDIKDAGNHGINSILRVPVRHQLLAVGRFDLIVYGPASEGRPTTTASRTEGGNAGNGFQSTSSDKMVLKTSCPSW